MVLRIAQALRRLQQDDRGFTLIELLIVIAIIAVIAAIAIPQVTNRIHEARVAADKANVRVLQGVADLWYLQNSEDNYATITTTGTFTVNGITYTVFDYGALAEQGLLREPVESPWQDGQYGVCVVAGPNFGRVGSSKMDEWTNQED